MALAALFAAAAARHREPYGISNVSLGFRGSDVSSSFALAARDLGNLLFVGYRIPTSDDV